MEPVDDERRVDPGRLHLPFLQHLALPLAPY